MDTDALFDKAMADVDAGRQDDARRRLAQVLQANPKHEQAWQALALIVPDMDQAIECLSRVLELNPHSVQAASYLALAREVKRRDGAPEALDAPTFSAGSGGNDIDRLPRLGNFLLEAKFITPAQLQAALVTQLTAASAGKPQRLGEILVEQGAISAAQLGFVVRSQRQRSDQLFWE